LRNYNVTSGTAKVDGSKEAGFSKIAINAGFFRDQPIVSRNNRLVRRSNAGYRIGTNFFVERRK
jgi:hypothetical protein